MVEWFKGKRTFGLKICKMSSAYIFQMFQSRAQPVVSGGLSIRDTQESFVTFTLIVRFSSFSSTVSKVEL